MLYDLLRKSKRPIKEIVSEKIEDLLTVSDKCVLFGAGAGGEKVYSFICKNIESGNDRIKCFVDNNPLKHGTYFMGKRVLAVDEAFHSYNGEAVIISCGEGDEIIAQLCEYGVPNDKIYIPDIAVIKENDVEFIAENMGYFISLYDCLADEKSKKVLGAILNYKFTHDISHIHNVADKPENQYFDEKLIKYSEEDVFIDCGGYIGDTIESYCLHNKGIYKKVICLEADADNCRIIENMANDYRIELHNIAAYHKEAELYFDKIGSGSGNILGGSKPRIRQVKVKGNTIDNICRGGGGYISELYKNGHRRSGIPGASRCSRYNTRLQTDADDFCIPQAG